MNIRKLLSKKAGVTLLEGLIAIALLALVASGTFGVLLSVSRKTDQPDRREDMVYAIEGLNDILKSGAFIMQDGNEEAPSYIKTALCVGIETNSANNNKPLSVGKHYVNCLLPLSCDRRTSEFFYEVAEAKVDFSALPNLRSSTFQNANIVGSQNPYSGNKEIASRSISYQITCNGYSL